MIIIRIHYILCFNITEKNITTLMDINRKVFGVSWWKYELVNIGYEFAKVRVDMAPQLFYSRFVKLLTCIFL